MTSDDDLIKLIRAAFLCSHKAAVAFLDEMKQAVHERTVAPPLA
jgi:hypothetical protein